jgi:hypothetical protein
VAITAGSYCVALDKSADDLVLTAETPLTAARLLGA